MGAGLYAALPFGMDDLFNKEKKIQLCCPKGHSKPNQSGNFCSFDGLPFSEGKIRKASPLLNKLTGLDIPTFLEEQHMTLEYIEDLFIHNGFSIQNEEVFYIPKAEIFGICIYWIDMGDMKKISISKIESCVKKANKILEKLDIKKKSYAFIS